MNSQKSRIHSRLAGFGISCLVFGIKYMMLYRNVRMLNAKHQIQSTLVKSFTFNLVSWCLCSNLFSFQGGLGTFNYSLPELCLANMAMGFAISRTC